MARFKIGEKVAAKYSCGSIKKDKTYIIQGFHCCLGCGLPCVRLKGLNEICKSTCTGTQGSTTGCGYKESNIREAYWEGMFAPLQNIADAIQYKAAVSIPELIRELEVTETQMQ